MTVSTTTTKAIYNGDGSTTAFPTTFEFFDTADIEVIERVIATGAETVKTLSTDYTVSGGNGATGTVTAVTAPASTVQWAIRRKTPLTQQIDYVENDDFPAETHEQGLDRGVMIAQERQEELDRALKFPVSDAAGLSPELPNSVDRKSLFLAFDASGDPIASAGPVGEIPVTAFMQTLLDDADAAAGRATLGVVDLGEDLADIGALSHTAGHVIESDGTDWTAALPRVEGQCRLTKSGADLQLARLNGVKLTIDGVNEIVPATPITLAATGLTIDTDHFIYAFMSGGMMTLEASTTGHATDATTGTEIKSGDSTRTLVGMARVVTGPAWADTLGQRFVLSYFNRRTIAATNTLASASTTSATYVDLTPSNQAEFLTWADEAARMDAGGASNVNLAGRTVISQLRLDGSGVGNETQHSTETAGFWGDVSVGHAAFLSEGKHDASLQGRNSSGSDTSTWEDLQLRAITRG